MVQRLSLLKLFPQLHTILMIHLVLPTSLSGWSRWRKSKWNKSNRTGFKATPNIDMNTKLLILCNNWKLKCKHKIYQQDLYSGNSCTIKRTKWRKKTNRHNQLRSETFQTVLSPIILTAHSLIWVIWWTVLYLVAFELAVNARPIITLPLSDGIAD